MSIYKLWLNHNEIDWQVMVFDGMDIYITN
jgi:hypothetical protein